MATHRPLEELPSGVSRLVRVTAALCGSCGEDGSAQGGGGRVQCVDVPRGEIASALRSSGPAVSEAAGEAVSEERGLVSAASLSRHCHITVTAGVVSAALVLR